MQTETPTTAQLPEKLFIIVTYHPDYDKPVPLLIPFPPVGFGMPVFGDRESAEKFVASPEFDIPYLLKEATWENIIRAGENPIAIIREHGDEDEYFYMFDPRPWGEWKGVEDMGYLMPMDDAAKVLREELGQG